MLPIIAILAVITALLLFWLSARKQKTAGLPGGRVIYADTSGWQPVEKPLYDPILGLTGKPDYLVKKGKQIIPVEVKSSRVMASPYDSHTARRSKLTAAGHRGRQYRSSTRCCPDWSGRAWSK